GGLSVPWGEPPRRELAALMHLRRDRLRPGGRDVPEEPPPELVRPSPVDLREGGEARAGELRAPPAAETGRKGHGERLCPPRRARRGDAPRLHHRARQQDA